jgi:hypothetical protein
MAKEQQPFQLSVEMLPEISVKTFRPRGNRLLIKPIAIEEAKIGSIHLGDSQVDNIKKTMINRGIVLTVGSEVQDKNIVPGSVVFFYRHGSEGGLREGNQELLLFCEYNILADLDPAAVVAENAQEVLTQSPIYTA